MLDGGSFGINAGELVLNRARRDRWRHNWKGSEAVSNGQMSEGLIVEPLLRRTGRDLEIKDRR